MTTLCVVTVLSIAGGLQAQAPVRLVGRVYDDARRTLEGVELIVNRRELRATSGTDGVFTIEVGPGDSTLAFRRIGYKPLLVSLKPLPPERDTILVELISSPMRLTELTVIAAPSKPLRYAGTTKYDDVFHRRKIGLGTLITREQIDQRFGSSIAELLQGIPGYRYLGGPPRQFSFARCKEPGGVAIFFDGMRQQVRTKKGARLTDNPVPGQAGDESPEIDVLSTINPSDVEMVEVYRGAGQIPGVFHWDGCAVIAVWTKWNK